MVLILVASNALRASEKANDPSGDKENNQRSLDDSSVPIIRLFDAMRAHNGDKLLSQFTHNAMLQRAKADGSVQTVELNAFAKSISQSDKHLDEKLLDVIVNKQGNLASVWTPYVFYLDGKVSHCGHNSFQLVKVSGEWKIQYLIDNVFNGNCDDFISTYKR